MLIVTPTSALPAPAGAGAIVPRDLAAAVAAQSQVGAASPHEADGAPAAPGPTLASAVSAAAARQDGLSPLLADLAAALNAPAVPSAVKAAIQKVLGFQLATSPPPTPADLRQAVSQSGLFLESRLAAQPNLPPADLKAALGDLGQVLSALAGDRSTQVHAEPVPPPPYPDGPQRGQPAAPSSLPVNVELQAVVGHLQRRVAAAQARQLLQQAASVPGEAGGARTGPWLFELPLATPQGAAIAQFEIDADQPPVADEKPERTWRARFTLDLEGVGPVHAHLALSGDDLKLGLFAEAGETAARLDQDRPRLALALQAEALNPQIAIRPGVPQTATVPAGRFVDNAA